MGRGVEDARVTRFVTFVVAKFSTWNTPIQRPVDLEEVCDWLSSLSVLRMAWPEGPVQSVRSNEATSKCRRDYIGRALAKARGPGSNLGGLATGHSS